LAQDELVARPQLVKSCQGQFQFGRL